MCKANCQSQINLPPNFKVYLQVDNIHKNHPEHLGIFEMGDYYSTLDVSIALLFKGCLYTPHGQCLTLAMH